MAQQNIALTTKGGVKAEIKPFINRKQRRQIRNALFGDKPFEVGKDTQDFKTSVTMGQSDAAEDETIKIMLVSLEGSTDNILERFLDLEDNDAQEIKDKIDEVTTPPSNEKKATGSVPTENS